MPRPVKQYSFNDLAGCVEQRRSRETGTMVGLYHGDQAGMENDPEFPWLTVCEDHSTISVHASLSLAKRTLGFPTNWCDECRDKIEEKR